jgi:TonB family protein
MSAHGISKAQAFRYEVAPSALTRIIPQGMPIKPTRVWAAIGAVVVLHAAVLAFKPSLFWSTPPIVMEESWEVDMDFLGEITQKSPQETALPNAEKSPEEAVPKNLLPQLPKKFQVEDEKPKEDSPENGEIDKALAEKKVEEDKSASEVPKMEEDANKIKMDDLKKRLAVEKLKQENKVSETMKAQKDAIAKLKLDASKENAAENSGSTGAAVGIMRNSVFQSALKSAVSRNFNLPESFKYTNSKLSVKLSIVIGAKGELLNFKVDKSSGNEVYDLAAISALKNASPLPTPPKDFVGQEIQFNF